jgi:hypothetical protein
MSDEKKNVYQLISAVSGDLCKDGISKDRTNTQGAGYKFRGIDDVYNAISPVMARHGLVIMPRILSRQITERESQAGKALFYVVVEAEFDFVSSHDNSSHTVRTFGEAMDSGDKATNKAMSAAYKYAAFQTFCIPTEGDNDADSSDHTVKTATKKQPKNEPYPEYPEAQFKANVSAWISVIQSKKQTAEHLINMISAKYTLTDVQKQSILQIGLEYANS